MLGTCVLLRSSSPDIERRAAAILRAAGNEVIAQTDLHKCAAVLEAGDIHLVVLDTSDGACVTELADLAKLMGVPVIISGDTLDTENFELFCEGKANHLVHGKDSLEALAVASEKVLREAPFGMARYAPRFGIETYKFELRDGDSLRDAIECFDEFLRVVEAPEPAASQLLAAAQELGENALYSAPRDERGRRHYGPRDREHGVAVEAGERARLSYAFDGRRLLLSAEDWFGSLLPSRIRTSLWKADRRAATNPLADAARGSNLRSVWESSSELVFNVEPGERTEVIAIRDIFDATERGGIHIFYSGKEQEAQDAVPTRTIQVSNSMLVDIRSHLARRRPAPAVTLRKKTATDTVRTAIPIRQHRATGEVVPTSDSEPVGVDTMFGLIHGATSTRHALALGLKFMTVCYRGAVAYSVRDEMFMRPVLGAGKIADWDSMRALTLVLSDDCRLTDLTRAGKRSRYSPRASCELDQQLTAMACLPRDSKEGYVLPIYVHDELRYVLFAFGTKYRKHLAERVVAALAVELEGTIHRHEVEPSIRTQRRRLGTR